MALSKAIQFIKAVKLNNEFREACNNSSSKKLILQQLNFNEVEFEDAINMQLVKCQTYEQAEIYQQIKIWFLLL